MECKWIDCKKRMPPHREIVLGLTQEGFVFASWNRKEKKWFEDGIEIFFFGNHIDFWMKLPPNPYLDTE